MAKVKVKIAVVVNSDGDWGCCGYAVKHSTDEQGMMDLAVDCLEDGGKPEQQYWITAELDLPEVKDAEAAVKKAA